MAAKLRKGDEVIVLAGKDKGKRGTVTSIVPKSGKAIVDGINMAIRHEKQTQTTQGGRLPKAMPMPLAKPCPSGPVVVSTPGACPYSG